MGLAKKLPDSTEWVSFLKERFYAVPESERDSVIQELGRTDSPDAARALVQLFDECQWRATRFKILRAVALHPHSRSLQLLFRIAQEVDDVPLAEAALWALGQSRHRWAARFLVHFHESCPPMLKAAVVGALGQIPDRTLAHVFLHELESELTLPLASQRSLLLQNWVLTLGELKHQQAVPTLIRLASRRTQGELSKVSLSALISLGKIARDPKVLDGCESIFQEDLLSYQLFSSVRTQIQFRGEWRLEDYLARLFGDATIHRNLPYELNYFSPGDVKEGLRLYAVPEHFERLCSALAKIDSPEIGQWYEELLPLSTLDPDQAGIALRSIASHLNEGMRGPLTTLRTLALQDPAAPLFRKWVEAVAMSLPSADAEFQVLCTSPEFKAWDETAKVVVINHLFHYGLCVQPSPARHKAVGKILEELLHRDASLAVQARCLRALGDLRLVSRKVLSFVEESKVASELQASAIYALEKSQPKGAAGVLSGYLDEKTASLSLLKAFAAQPELPSQVPTDAWIGRHLAPKATDDHRVEALRLLACHPRTGLLNAVAECLNGCATLWLPAILALKASGSEAAVEWLGPSLKSSQEYIVGRAIDALCALPGMRAKRLLIDYLADHPDDHASAEKIARSLLVPDSGKEYFLGRLDELLRSQPHHPHLDALVGLRERMDAGPDPITASPKARKGVDITAIDGELRQKIPGYDEFDETVRSALRAAEVPYRRPELYDDFVDKSGTIIQYVKAADIALERMLGRKILFPRLEKGLHEFQNQIHAASLNESQPSGERVLAQLGLDKHFTPQSAPIHKMGTIGHDILNARIVDDRFRTLDGLRAWAVMLLLFARHAPARPLIPLKNITDDQVVSLAKRLISLQEARNPMAHRQTLLKLVDADHVRSEVIGLLNLFQKIF